VSVTGSRTRPRPRRPSGAGTAFGPWFPAEDGDRFFLDARYERRLPVGPLAWRSSPRGGGLRPTSRPIPARSPGVRLGVTGGWTSAARTGGAELRVTAAAALGVTPPQHLWYLGGRNTLPGHPFHEYVGDRAAVADVTVWREVVPRYLRLRLLAAAGWADAWMGTAPRPDWSAGLTPWDPGPTDGVRASVGAGVGLLHGILRLDYAVRTDTGDGTFILSVDPRLWGFL
jgi:hypothetical protein